MVNPRVFVTQECSHDFIGAEQYGEVVFLTRDDLNNTKGSLHNEAVVAQIRHALLKFLPSIDYIVIAGSPYVSALVFMLLASMGIKEVRVLRWVNRDRVYVPMTISISNQQRIEA